MRLDNPIPRARATTGQRAPRSAKPCQSAPSRAPAQNEANFLLCASASLCHIPSNRPSARRRKTKPPLTPASSRLPAYRASQAFTSPDSPSIPPAKPAKTHQKPSKNPHFARPRRTPIPSPTPEPINPYIHSLPQSSVHATFFPFACPPPDPAGLAFWSSRRALGTLDRAFFRASWGCRLMGETEQAPPQRTRSTQRQKDQPRITRIARMN